MIDFQHPIPILRIFSEEKAREFYLGFLGFTVDWEHRFSSDSPLYMQIRRGNIVLHLSEHVGDACPGSNMYIPMEGLEEFQQELIGKQYKYLRPGINHPGDIPDYMELVDPFGNHLRVARARTSS